MHLIRAAVEGNGQPDFDPDTYVNHPWVWIARGDKGKSVADHCSALYLDERLKRALEEISKLPEAQRPKMLLVFASNIERFTRSQDNFDQLELKYSNPEPGTPRVIFVPLCPPAKVFTGEVTADDLAKLAVRQHPSLVGNPAATLAAEKRLAPLFDGLAAARATSPEAQDCTVPFFYVVGSDALKDARCVCPKPSLPVRSSNPPTSDGLCDTEWLLPRPSPEQMPHLPADG